MYTLLFLCCIFTSAIAQRNNVCPTFFDYYTIRWNPRCWYDFAADSDVEQIIAKNGYPVQTHKVQTEDGYILTMFRVYSDDSNQDRGPVFLQHGGVSSSSQYVLKGKDSLAFILADAGYDVWLANTRGTMYSEDHVNLTVFDEEYWDYSSDELGIYDTPAQINHIANITGKKGEIVFVGHSLGTTEALIYGSWLPQEAQSNVKLFVLLAPVIDFAYTNSALLRLARPAMATMYETATNLNLLSAMSREEPRKKAARALCLSSPISMRVCWELTKAIAGTPQQTDPSMIPVLLNHFPAGLSPKVAKQASDFFSNNYFGRFDYGEEENLKKYGTTFPPSFNLSAFSVPVAIAFGKSDWISTEEDSTHLYEKFPLEMRHGLHEISADFNHIDFVTGRNIKTLLNDYVLEVIDSMN